MHSHVRLVSHVAAVRAARPAGASHGLQVGPFLVESLRFHCVCFTAFPCRITFVSHCVRFHCLQAAQSLPITVCVHCVRVHCRQVARQTLNPVWNAQYTLTVENLATPLIIEAFVSRAHDTRLLAVFACQSFLSIAADL